MKVVLLSSTPNALDLLLRTKNTRLKFESDPATWTDAQRAEHLSYMRDTIKSSWEFVEYVFEISGVTRAFTHQLVRTRTGAYAQESQRTVDASNNGYLNPFFNPLGNTVKGHDRANIFKKGAEEAFGAYRVLLHIGASAQDARNVLPTGTFTSIVAKFSLRTLHEMAKVRLCVRTQGEYQDVFRRMRELVIAEHPWVGEHRFIEVHCVSEGTCAFPRFGKKECKFYDSAMDLDVKKASYHDRFWSESKQVAVPVAKSGKTM